jgi:superfamily II DNA/RNA helicase
MSRECPKAGEAGEDGERKERYIPGPEDDSEAGLFHNFQTGINFAKQNEISCSLTGTGADSFTAITSFAETKLSDLMKMNIERSGYKTPTPVQKYSLPVILGKRDLMACAQTGSGKTAAYALPIMTNILHDGIESSALSEIQCPQALILAPTRELALQIYNECRKFSYESMIKSGILYGGVDMGHQLRQIGRGKKNK